MHRKLPILFIAIITLLPLALLIDAQERRQDSGITFPPPLFDNESSNFTNSGSVKLSWQRGYPETDGETTEYELQRALKSDFSDAKSYYRGPDRATYISGLANGSYYFRLREIENNRPQSDWSVPVSVRVEHHSLGLAFTLFGIGGVVFILTVLVVMRGANLTDAVIRATNQQSLTKED